MPSGEQFSYTVTQREMGVAGVAPILKATLSVLGKSIEVEALIDSGARISLLPFGVGLNLGLNWDAEKIEARIAGAFGESTSKLVTASLRFSRFPPVRMVFAWSKSNDTPLVLGQTNFFMEFDICFHWSRDIFDVRPKT